MIKDKKEVLAFAPATVANVAVGFDLLGFSVDIIGDCIGVSKRDDGKIVIENMSDSLFTVPEDSKKNTASVALSKMKKENKLPFGFHIRIKKGIPLASGLGGSAASAVGAVVAANELLEAPVSKEKLFRYALSGEAISSGSPHGDNVAPCLLGGFIFTPSLNYSDILSIPVSQELLCVLVHPHIQVNTKEARASLKKDVSLKDHVKQSANLAASLIGFIRNDVNLIAKSLRDIIIEPQRAKFISGFHDAQNAAFKSKALACSISGSGPTLFALAANKSDALIIKEKMIAAFKSKSIKADAWTSNFSNKGARIL